VTRAADIPEVIMQTHKREPVLDVYHLVLGAFLFVCPWLFAFKFGIMRADAWAVSLLILSFSATSWLALATWPEWIVLASGVWLLISPWVLGHPHTAAMKVDVAIGLIVTYLAALALWLAHYMPGGGIPDITPQARSSAEPAPGQGRYGPAPARATERGAPSPS
jgi:hypothetical protein